MILAPRVAVVRATQTDGQTEVRTNGWTDKQVYMEDIITPFLKFLHIRSYQGYDKTDMGESIFYGSTYSTLPYVRGVLIR